MNSAERAALIANGCWLCERPLGKRIEWHHFVPKSRGGNETVPVHPICHRTLHANFSNTELQAFGDDIDALRRHDAIEKFIRWVKNKPADFHAPTRKKKN